MSLVRNRIRKIRLKIPITTAESARLNVGQPVTAHPEQGRPHLYLTARGQRQPGPMLVESFPGQSVFRGAFDPTGKLLAVVSSVSGIAQIFSVEGTSESLQESIDALKAIQESDDFDSIPEGLRSRIQRTIEAAPLMLASHQVPRDLLALVRVQAVYVPGHD